MADKTLKSSRELFDRSRGRSETLGFKKGLRQLNNFQIGLLQTKNSFVKTFPVVAEGLRTTRDGFESLKKSITDIPFGKVVDNMSGWNNEIGMFIRGSKTAIGILRGFTQGIVKFVVGGFKFFKGIGKGIKGIFGRTKEGGQQAKLNKTIIKQEKNRRKEEKKKQSIISNGMFKITKLLKGIKSKGGGLITTLLTVGSAIIGGIGFIFKKFGGVFGIFKTIGKFLFKHIKRGALFLGRKILQGGKALVRMLVLGGKRFGRFILRSAKRFGKFILRWGALFGKKIVGVAKVFGGKIMRFLSPILKILKPILGPLVKVGGFFAKLLNPVTKLAMAFATGYEIGSIINTVLDKFFPKISRTLEKALLHFKDAIPGLSLNKQDRTRLFGIDEAERKEKLLSNKMSIDKVLGAGMTEKLGSLISFKTGRSFSKEEGFEESPEVRNRLDRAERIKKSRLVASASSVKAEEVKRLISSGTLGADTVKLLQEMLKEMRSAPSRNAEEIEKVNKKKGTFSNMGRANIGG